MIPSLSPGRLRGKLGRFALAAPRVRTAAPLLLLAWCGFQFFYGLGASPFYRTEALRALIAVECLGGNWLVPTLYGEPFLTKPPGMYAAIGLASLPFGKVTELSARLPSAVAATVTVLVLWGMFRRALGGRAGLAAALLAPVSLLWLDKAPSAEIDMLQVMWVAAALACFLRALEREEAGERSHGWWLLALLGVAGGFLTKWTAPAFFYLTVLPLLAWRKRLGVLVRPGHLIGVAAAAVVCAAWAGAVVAQTGWEPLVETVGREAVQRFDPHHGGRAYPWGEVLLYPFQVLGANLPWSALALVALRPRFFRLWDERGRRLLQLLHCWTWPNLLFWTVLPEHAVRYAFPMCPGLVGLGLMVCVGWARAFSLRPCGGALGWGVSSLSLPPCGGGWGGGYTTAGDGSLVRRAEGFTSHPNPPPQGGREKGNDPLRGRRWLTPIRALVAVLLLWAVAKVVYVEVVCPGRTLHRQARPTGEQLAALVPQGEILYLFRLKDEGIMFYYGRPVRRLHQPGEIARLAGPVYLALMAEEWQQWRRVAPVRAVRWFRDQQGDPFVLARVEPPGSPLPSGERGWG